MSYDAYRLRQVKDVTKDQLWRVLLGALIIALVAVGVFAVAAAVLLTGPLSDAGPGAIEGFLAGETPQSAWTVLFLTGLMGLGAVLAAWALHGRGLGSLLGPWKALWRDFGRVMAGVIVLYGALMLIPLPVEVERGLELRAWLGLLPVTLIVLFIQISGEEIVFRGYLQSQLAARFASPVIWVGVPSVLFGLVHYGPDIFGANTWLVVIWAGLFGLAAADLTARAGNLGPALALHFGNNILAVAVSSMQGDLSGLALYLMPFGPDDTETLRQFLPLDLLSLFLSWLVARIAIKA